ncbi:hypothetical protein ACV3PA_16950 (plasmid) [Exiguobacterium acetylicum]
MRVVELIQYHFEQNEEFLKKNDYRSRKIFRLNFLFFITYAVLGSILFFNSKIESLTGFKVNQELNISLFLLNILILIIIGKKLDKQIEFFFQNRKIKFLNEYPAYLKEIHNITFSNEINHLIDLLKEHNSDNYSLKNINFAVFSLMISIISLTITVMPLSQKMNWYTYLLIVFSFIFFIKIFFQQKYNFRIFPKRKKVDELISILKDIQLTLLIKENQEKKGSSQFRRSNLKNHQIRRRRYK